MEPTKYARKPMISYTDGSEINENLSKTYTLQRHAYENQCKACAFQQNGNENVMNTPIRVIKI